MHFLLELSRGIGLRVIMIWLCHCAGSPILFAAMRTVSVVAQNERPQPRAWRMFRSPEFEIEYPAYGILDLSNPNHASPPETRVAFSERFGTGQGTGEDKFSFVIVVHANPMRMSTARWAESRWHPDTISSNRQLVVVGRQARQFTVTTVGSVNDYVLIDDGQRMFELRYPKPSALGELDPVTRAKFETAFGKMVRSFHIIS